MAIPTLPTWSLKLNSKDVSTTYGLIVRDVDGIDIAPPVDVKVSRLPGLARPAISEPVPKARKLTIKGTIIGTTPTDLSQRISRLAQEIGFTSYGIRVVNVQIKEPNFGFDCVYGGDWDIEYIGGRVVATHAKIRLSLIVVEYETETTILSLANGVLNASDATPVNITSLASKGGTWVPSATFDQGMIKIRNDNATSISTVKIKALFQKAMRRISATPSNNVKMSSGIYSFTNAPTWANGDTHTIKYPTNDGEFTPKSLSFSIILTFGRLSQTGATRTLFSCNNATAADRTVIDINGGNVRFSVGPSASRKTVTVSEANLLTPWTTIIARCDGSYIYLKVGNSTTAQTALSGVSPVDPNGNFFIGTDASGGTACEGNIGEVVIIGTGAVDPESVTWGISSNRPVIENTQDKITEFLQFGTDFRPQLGLDGIGRGTRTLTATATDLIAQNEELYIDLARRRAYTVHTTDADQYLDVTNKFDVNPEWPTLGQFGIIIFDNTPKQASVAYDILGRATVLQ